MFSRIAKARAAMSQSLHKQVPPAKSFFLCFLEFNSPVIAKRKECGKPNEKPSPVSPEMGRKNYPYMVGL